MKTLILLVIAIGAIVQFTNDMQTLSQANKPRITVERIAMTDINQ